MYSVSARAGLTVAAGLAAVLVAAGCSSSSSQGARRSSSRSRGRATGSPVSEMLATERNPEVSCPKRISVCEINVRETVMSQKDLKE